MEALLIVQKIAEITIYRDSFRWSTAQIRKLSDTPLRQALASLGGWPVAQREWSPPPFSMEQLLGRLRGEYNERVLIDQWVGPDDKNSSVNILQVRPK
jgi:membrane metallo-endopeptidase-like protein 1